MALAEEWGYGKLETKSKHSHPICENPVEALKSSISADIIARVGKYECGEISNGEIICRDIEDIFNAFKENELINKKEQEYLLLFLKSDKFLKFKDKLSNLDYNISFNINDSVNLNFLLKQIDLKTNKFNWNDFYNWTIDKLENYKSVSESSKTKKIGEIQDLNYYSYRKNDKYWIIIINTCLEDKNRTQILNTKAIFDSEIKVIDDSYFILATKPQKKYDTILMYSSINWKSVIFNVDSKWIINILLEVEWEEKIVWITKRLNKKESGRKSYNNNRQIPLFFDVEYWKDKNEEKIDKKWILILEGKFQLVEFENFNEDIEIKPIDSNRYLIYNWKDIFLYSKTEDKLIKIEWLKAKNIEEARKKNLKGIWNILGQTRDFLDYMDKCKLNLFFFENKMAYFNKNNELVVKENFILDDKNIKLEFVNDSMFYVSTNGVKKYYAFDKKEDKIVVLDNDYDYKIDKSLELIEYKKKSFFERLKWLKNLFKWDDGIEYSYEYRVIKKKYEHFKVYNNTQEVLEEIKEKEQKELEVFVWAIQGMNRYKNIESLKNSIHQDLISVLNKIQEQKKANIQVVDFPEEILKKIQEQASKEE